MNEILNTQNEQSNIDLLAAQRKLYSKAKRVFVFQTILAVPGVIVWSALVAYDADLQIYAAYWGVVISLLDFAFTRWSNSLKEKAAKIQELFDCNVLKISWNTLKVGMRPALELIKENATEYKKRAKKHPPLVDWYNRNIDAFTLPLARLVCQRINCSWDYQLQQKYAIAIAIITSILCVIVFGVGFVGGYTMEKFLLAVLVPLMPVFLLGFREYFSHKDAAARIEQLRAHTQQLWERAVKKKLKDEELTRASRQLQDEIFNHRRNNPLVFDWIYNRLWGKEEEQIDQIVLALVDDAKDNGII